MSIFVGDNKVAGIGNPGKTGKPGESAYEIAKKYGYEGTEEEFALELSNAATKPDWLEENENSPSFIRNKPFGENEDGTIKTLDPKYLPKGSGDGVTSWNDLEDKPFYTEPGVKIILEEQAVDGFEDFWEGLHEAWIEAENNIKYGDILIVKWDGVEYTCSVEYFRGYLLAGNTNYYYNHPETECEMPFMLYIFNEGFGFNTYSTENKHTVEIKKDIEVVHYINNKFIEDMYSTKSIEEVIYEKYDFMPKLGGFDDGITSPEEYTSGEYYDSCGYVLVDGQKYIVEFDGHKYECDVKNTCLNDANNVKYLGNTMMWDGMDYITTDIPYYLWQDTGEPFFIGFYNTDFESAYNVHIISTREMHSVKITTINKYVKQVPSECIESPDWSQNDTNSGGYIQNRTHYVNKKLMSISGDHVTGMCFHIDNDNYIKVADNIDFNIQKIKYINVINDQDEDGRYSTQGVEAVYIQNSSTCVWIQNMYNTPYAVYIENEIMAENMYGPYWVENPDDDHTLTPGLYIKSSSDVSLESENALSYTIIYEQEEIVKLDPAYVDGMYYTEGGRITIVDTVSIPVGKKYHAFGRNVQLKYGSEYICIFDGIEYTFVWDGSFGGEIDWDSGELSTNSEYPFCFYIDREWINIYVADTNGHTISIYQDTEEIIHKIDPKYLPEVSGGVSSWNDLTDKPFYDNTIIEELVPECEIVIPINQGQPAMNPFTIDIIDGETYLVIWDGEEYECVAYIAEGPNSPSIGNASVANAVGGNDEPFFITVYNDNAMVFGSSIGTHTISIIRKDGIVKTIDGKYLPEALQFGTEIVREVVMEEPDFLVPSSSYNERIDLNIYVAIGDKYIVSWDGVEYECVARLVSDNTLIIGNENIQDSSKSDTKEPFFMQLSTNSIKVYGRVNSDSYIDVNVYKLVENVTTIDSKYVFGGDSVVEDVTLLSSFVKFEEDKHVDISPISIIDSDYFILTAGNTYKLSIGDMVFECTAKRCANGEIYLGNLNLYNSSYESSGENYVFLVRKNRSYYVAYTGVSAGNYYNVTVTGNTVRPAHVDSNVMPIGIIEDNGYPDIALNMTNAINQPIKIIRDGSYLYFYSGWSIDIGDMYSRISYDKDDNGNYTWGIEYYNINNSNVTKTFMPFGSLN